MERFIHPDQYDRFHETWPDAFLFVLVSFTVTLNMGCVMTHVEPLVWFEPPWYPFGWWVGSAALVGQLVFHVNRGVLYALLVMDGIVFALGIACVANNWSLGIPAYGFATFVGINVLTCVLKTLYFYSGDTGHMHVTQRTMAKDQELQKLLNKGKPA